MEYRDWTKKDGIGRDISTSLLGYGCMRFPTLPDGRIDEVRAEKLLNTGFVLDTGGAKEQSCYCAGE